MPGRRPTVVKQLRSFAQTPVMLVALSGMWLACCFGRAIAAMRFMGRGMQSPELKAKALNGYQPTWRDVFVCTYSKSGTNWVLQIAYQIAHHGQGTFDYIHEVVPWPESPLPNVVRMDETATFEDAPTGLRIIKTHLESRYVPYSPEAKYIVVVRDPKDVFVSSYHFSAGMLPKHVRIPVADWLALFLSPDFPYGSWAEHLASYWPWRTRPNVLFLNYHDMKADPIAPVRQIAALMQVELSDAVLARIVEQSSFAHMKRLDHAFSPSAPFPFNHLLGQPSMIRSGQAGASTELLDATQQQQIDAYVQQELQHYGCDAPYSALCSGERASVV